MELKQILKLAFTHNGSAVIDVISPCVAYGNKDQFSKSYIKTQNNTQPLHDIDIIADGKAFLEEELKYSFKPIREIEYDNTSIYEAKRLLLDEKTDDILHTGVLYINSKKKTLFKSLDLNYKDSFSQSSSDLKLDGETFNSFVERWNFL